MANLGRIYEEQGEFLKMLAGKLELPDVNSIGEYLDKCKDKESIDFLNKQLEKYMNEGKLESWVNLVVENNSPIILYLSKEEKSIFFNIRDFWSWYKSVEKSLMVKGVLPGLSEEERLDILCGGRYCYTESICDFHESDDEYDDGDTVFSYKETRRYM